MTRLPVVIVGGGPGGLAVSAELKRRGIAHRVLERGDCPGYNWTQLYDSLTLHTGKHLSALPGRPFPRSVPLFPRRDHFVDYLRDYAEALPLVTGCDVRRIARTSAGWELETSRGDLAATAVVAATGIIASPRLPVIAGREAYRGQVMHSIEYRRPQGFAGKRVLVVGVGNSAGEIASELAHAGAAVTIAVRSGANVVPRDIAEIPVQYLSLLIRGLPPAVRAGLARGVARLGELRRGPPVLPRPAHGPLDAIPLIGFGLVDAIRSGAIDVRGALDRFTPEGMRFADGREGAYDVVVLATGFTAALEPFGTLVRRDARGFASRIDRVRSADHPDLYFVGHTYDAAGGLYNIGRDARAIARHLAATA